MTTNFSDNILNDIVSPEYPVDPLELLGERNFNNPRVIPREEIGSPVQEFFRDKSIFLTGVTGFVGCVLLEKLLRSCPHIKRIFLLIREKKGKSSQERLEEIFDDRLYNRLKYEVPNYTEKLSLVIGDIEQSSLGLSREDRNKLTNVVNIIYHCAAYVRFNETLTNAVKNKVQSTKYIMDLARDCKTLKAFMYVSTAYSFCPYPVIEETIPDMPVHYREFLKIIEVESESVTKIDESKLLMGWPNSYSFSKALTESMLKEEAQDLPLAIFRPSVVMCTYREPVKGWINTIHGPTPYILGIQAGILRFFPGDENKKFLNIVPVDMTINALICATKETSECFSSKRKYGQGISIYNYVNEYENSPTWHEIDTYVRSSIRQWPHLKVSWIYGIKWIKNRILFIILWLLFHRVRGYLIDGIMIISGKKPRMTKIYQKFYDGLPKVKYFVDNQWIFKNTKIRNLWDSLTLEDRQMFFFNMADVLQKPYFQTSVLGMRVYFLKDDIQSLPAARKRYKRLYRIYIALKYTSYILIIFMILKLLYIFNSEI